MLVFLIVLAVVAIAVFVGLGVLAKALEKEGESASGVRKFRVLIPLALIVLMVISFVIGGIKIIDSTEVGVVRTFGNISKEITSGFNIVNPISDTVTTYDLRVHVNTESFASYTKDAQPLTASIEYQYALDPTYVLQVAKEYGSYDILESKLGNVVQEKAKIVFAKYSAMTLLENRSTLSTEVATEVKTLEDLYHITFTSVIVQDIDFSDAFEASVEAKMTAEQDALRAEQEKKTAVIKAEQEKEVASINAEAAIEQAKGEAEALEITRQALENMPDTWIAQQYLEKWDGKLPTIMSDGANLMITPDLSD
jgi:regulator of protease activity HflC (stomatin/prohibitin superfamily)